VIVPIYDPTIQQPDITASPSARAFDPCHGGRFPLFTAEQFRTKVAESAEKIKNTDVPSEIRKIERSMESYSLSALNEDWLADNFDKMLRSQVVLSEDEALGERLDSKAVAKIEEHVLRCLGAAVSCSGIRSQRSCNASFLIPQAHWVTYHKRLRSEARLPASYIATRTKRCLQIAFLSPI
jgi:hypothetical protein